MYNFLIRCLFFLYIFLVLFLCERGCAMRIQYENSRDVKCWTFHFTLFLLTYVLFQMIQCICFVDDILERRWIFFIYHLSDFHAHNSSELFIPMWKCFVCLVCQLNLFLNQKWLKKFTFLRFSIVNWLSWITNKTWCYLYKMSLWRSHVKIKRLKSQISLNSTRIYAK